MNCHEHDYLNIAFAKRITSIKSVLYRFIQLFKIKEEPDGEGNHQAPWGHQTRLDGCLVRLLYEP